MATGQAFNTPHRLKIQIRIEYEQKFPVAKIEGWPELFPWKSAAGALSEKKNGKGASMCLSQKVSFL